MKRVVVITGAAGVLCREIAKDYCVQGDAVALVDINADALKTTTDEFQSYGYECRGYVANVLDKESLIKAKNQIIADFKSIDILINGAGGNSPKATTFNEFEKEKQQGKPDFFSLEKEGVDFVFNLNFMGTFLATQVFAEKMLEGKKGVIINISSMNAFTPLTKIPAYSAAKAAISNFTQWLAVYFAESGIRVNAIAPGFFATNQNKALLFKEDGSLTERSHKIIKNTPMARFGKPEELLGTIRWLSDDTASGFVTGIVVPIDGGFSAYSGV